MKPASSGILIHQMILEKLMVNVGGILQLKEEPLRMGVGQKHTARSGVENGIGVECLSRPKQNRWIVLLR